VLRSFYYQILDDAVTPEFTKPVVSCISSWERSGSKKPTTWYAVVCLVYAVHLGFWSLFRSVYILWCVCACITPTGM